MDVSPEIWQPVHVEKTAASMRNFRKHQPSIRNQYTYHPTTLTNPPLNSKKNNKIFTEAKAIDHCSGLQHGCDVSCRIKMGSSGTKKKIATSGYEKCIRTSTILEEGLSGQSGKQNTFGPSPKIKIMTKIVYIYLVHLTGYLVPYPHHWLWLEKNLYIYFFRLSVLGVFFLLFLWLASIDIFAELFQNKTLKPTFWRLFPSFSEKE